MTFNRVCPMCKMDRIPESKIVKEGKNKYVIYTCRICKHSDIERWADRPRPKLWDGFGFKDNGSFFDEEAHD